MYSGTLEKITVYGFPTDPVECDTWVNALPNKIEKVTKFIGVCRKHWPVHFEKITKKGSERPLYPPSLFPDIPDSFRPQIGFHLYVMCRKEKSIPYLETKHQLERTRNWTRT